MRKPINQIITASYYRGKQCEYADLKRIKVKYEVLQWLHFRVIKMYEPYVLLEKLEKHDDEYIRTGIRECFLYFDMDCYLYTQDAIKEALLNDQIIHIPEKIKKYEGEVSLKCLD